MGRQVVSNIIDFVLDDNPTAFLRAMLWNLFQRNVLSYGFGLSKWFWFLLLSQAFLLLLYHKPILLGVNRSLYFADSPGISQTNSICWMLLLSEWYGGIDSTISKNKKCKVLNQYIISTRMLNHVVTNIIQEPLNQNPTVLGSYVLTVLLPAY